MWPGWGVGLDQATGCNLSFMEAISRRMQVPDRLKVAGEEEETFSSGGPGNKPQEENLPPAFQMHVPDRLLLAEMMTGAFKPLWEKQRQQRRCPLISDPPWESAVFGAPCPFLSLPSRSRSQKHKRLVHPGRVQKKRTWAENSLLVLGGQRHDWLEHSFPPAPSRQCPVFPSLEGRIYTLQNSLRVLRFLGLRLLRLLRRPGRAQLSPQDTGLAAEGVLEELGAAEMLAMRRQLAKISGRLRCLEEEHVGWRQREVLVYSVLLSVCLLDLWLWLHR
ncbi:mitochondrial fission factor-like isoform X1 [Tiliqua scincoides]|uniref:mitochondrial fission factor-like isoform X1 n=1 Tax=Tiliqua scincoides TaxID=71010 RepID=UPI003463206D